MPREKKTLPKKTVPRVDAERARTALMARSVTAIRGLTPDRLSRTLEAFDMGYLREATLLWQKIKDRCDTTKCVAAKREMDAALLNWEVLTVDDSPEAKLHQEALQAAYNGLVSTDALDQNKRGGVATLIQQMMHAQGHKYAVHEIVWDPRGADLTAEFRFVPLQFFENTAGRLRFLPTEFAALGEDLEDAGWMVTVGAGLMEATSIAYLFKVTPLRAWLVFCDKVGMPGLHGQTDATQGSPEWIRFRDALASFGEDWALLTSTAAKITPIDLKAGGQLPHPLLVDRMDRAISRLWRGNDLGTMAKDGQAVGANPQESETDILGAADALLISEALQHYFDRPLIRYRFGTEPKAYFQLQPKTKVNHDVELRIDDYLIKWGVQRGKRELLQRYGRPEMEPQDEPATAPSMPAAPVGGAQFLGNEAAVLGADTLFKANAAAQELAARRPVFRPVAEQLARLLAMEPAARAVAAAEMRITSGQLARSVLAQAPDLARPVAEAIGAAVASGMAENAAKTAQKR